MSEENRIRDTSGDHKNFIQIPNVVLLQVLDPHEFVLWAVCKMVAREDGECYLTTENLATLAMMSRGKVHAARKRLLEIGLLVGEKRQDPGQTFPVWHLRIPDLWQENTLWQQENPTLRDKIALKEVDKERRWERGQEKRDKERERRQNRLHCELDKETLAD